jgi:type IV secretion system protein VirB9
MRVVATHASRRSRRLIAGDSVAVTCALLLGTRALTWGTCVLGDTVPDGAPGDARIRVLEYRADEVYRLKGYVGYQVDLEFEPGETFVGLGTGDLDSLTFASQDNHLFLKPRAGGVDTNLTVLTTRRAYHFDYTASERRPEPAFGDVIYVLRFTYPPPSEYAADRVEQSFISATNGRWNNFNYVYSGNAELRPEAAFDDGVQTRLRFRAQQELPAVFVGNADGTESLVNFTVDGGDLVVHRLSRHFILRRGRLEGCIVNQGFTGSAERLHSGTVAPAVERATRKAP